MREKLVIGLIAILAIASVGCVPSLHPFYSEGDVVFDKCLIGRWSDRDYKFSWQFDRRGHKGYRLTQIDEDGEPTYFEATLFRLNGRTFLDVAPIGNKEKLGTNVLRAHSLIAMTVENERLRISTMDHGWLRNILARFPEALKHTYVDNELVITDTTENIQSFIRKAMNSPAAFGPADEIIKQAEIKLN